MNLCSKCFAGKSWHHVSFILFTAKNEDLSGDIYWSSTRTIQSEDEGGVRVEWMEMNDCAG